MCVLDGMEPTLVELFNAMCLEKLTDFARWLSFIPYNLHMFIPSQF